MQSPTKKKIMRRSLGVVHECSEVFPHAIVAFGQLLIECFFSIPFSECKTSKALYAVEKVAS